MGLSNLPPGVTVSMNKIVTVGYVYEGDMAECTRCGQSCKVECGNDGKTGEKSNHIQFIHCDLCKADFVVGVDTIKIMIKH